MRETESIVSADGVQESISLAKDTLDPTLTVRFLTNDDTSRIHVNLWELNEVGSQIVANVTEAMDRKGQIQVSVDRVSLGKSDSEEHGLSPGDYMRIIVEDDGPGIHPKVLGRVFDPYFTTKKAGDCNGLGLAIAFSLVRGWNGDLSVESLPGQGATFEIMVPTRD